MQQLRSNPAKHYVEVIGLYGLDGSFKPYRIRTKDGRIVSIDHISEVKQAASVRSGGQGTRYTCRAKGRQFHLFHETLPDGEFWFAESV